MKYTKLGNSELEVSRVCMGCMGFGDAKNGQHGWTIDDGTYPSAAAVTEAIGLGSRSYTLVNIDT